MNSLCRVALLALALVMPLTACDRHETFVEREQPSSALMDTFASYASVDDVQNTHFANTSWTVIEKSGHEPDDPRPPFDIFTVSVPGYAHLGFAGDLRLHFFNDRLESVWFHPDDPQGYLRALAGTGLDLAEQAQGSFLKHPVSNHTSVWASRDYRGLLYVAWEDGRLASQQRRWIMRYA